MKNLKELPISYQDDIKKVVEILDDNTNRFSQMLLKSDMLVRIDNLL